MLFVVQHGTFDEEELVLPPGGGHPTGGRGDPLPPTTPVLHVFNEWASPFDFS